MYDLIKKSMLVLLFAAASATLKAQDPQSRLANAYEKFMADTQLSSASVSFYVVESSTGKVVFQANERVGLAPASTQKIITAATAYELLGPDFRYVTNVYAKAASPQNKSQGNLFINGNFDPTLGSFRWPLSAGGFVDSISRAVKSAGYKTINKISFSNDSSGEMVPDGWIWQDVGNYYGAGASRFIWRENQFDVFMQSGSDIGDPVRVKGYKPSYNFNLKPVLVSAAKGSGDQAYVYYPLQDTQGLIRGSIPVNESNFSISAAMTHPRVVFASELRNALVRSGIKYNGSLSQIADRSENMKLIFQHQSQPLDSVIYWFLRKSINLYGEALIKTVVRNEEGKSTYDGIEKLKAVWKAKGLMPGELAMVDGSGLSPLNRVTTHAQVTVLQYARQQPWFGGYYAAIPEYNGMKMKSGTIHKVKGFCGYHNGYTFSLLVNNYNGAESAIIKKMYALLNELK